ncbi:hypothetical protein [Salipaludibacillus daqingensis]|uniref:hypothetical protein n=1 Tax=Salipaludibacillus daqingensis TaxID=3041001 RepID=UPI002476FD37|nr:hypothetical protein [Salipaludibacillus daqingensis]
MKYLVDHEKKSIHRTTYANDKCRFNDTHVDKREFTIDLTYIERLKIEGNYEECEFCNILAAKPQGI